MMETKTIVIMTISMTLLTIGALFFQIKPFIPPLLKIGEPSPSWKIEMDSFITRIEVTNSTTTIIHFANGTNVTLIGNINQLHIYGNGTITPYHGGG